MILIIYCLIIGITKKVDALLVVALLISIIYICSIEVFDKKLVFVVAACIMLSASFFFPITLSFFPVVLYGIFVFRDGGCGVVTIIIFAFVFFANEKTDVLWLLLIIIGGLIAFVLYNKSRLLDDLEEKLKKTRDDGIELQLLLEDNNRSLRDKQDYEVYTATLRERNRIAREIHDNVGHMLSRSILMIGALKAVNRDENLATPIEELSLTLNGAMDSVRESVHDLHDEAVDMKKAIEDLVNAFSFAKVNLDIDVSSGVKARVKYSFIAIVKEALNNVIKHSDADLVEIRIIEDESIYQLIISDNGSKKAVRNIYEDEATGVRIGIGLSNMEDRVKTLGGKINFYTENGFKIYIKVPK